MGNDNQDNAAAKFSRQFRELDAELRADEGGPLGAFVMGLRFYSILPVPFFDHLPPNLARMAPALGFVSLVLALPGILVLGLGQVLSLPYLVSIILAVITQIAIGGAMSEDALADCLDGFGGRTREKIIEIMRDPRHGTYGTLALVAQFALRIFALATLFVGVGLGIVFVWAGAQILARQISLWPTLRLGAATGEGAAASAGDMVDGPFYLGLGFAFVLFLALCLPFAGVWSTLVGAGLAFGFILIWTRICAARLGGYTGDLLGGGQAIVELILLISLSALV